MTGFETSRPVPCDLGELAAAVHRALVAVSRHRRGLSTGQLGAAAAFLVSPAECLPGLACGATEDVVWVADAEVALPERAELMAISEAAARAALNAGVGTSTWLREPRATWLKAVRSGAYRVVFGPEVLWGLPRLQLTDGVTLSAAEELVATWLQTPAGEPVATSGVVRSPVSGAAVLVEDAGRGLVLLRPGPV